MSDLTCHVHVGMAKTGTTSVQQNLSAVHGQNVQYLPAKSTNHGMLFANLFEARPWRHRRHLYMQRTRQDVSILGSRQRNHLTVGMNKAADDPMIKGIIFSAERMTSVKPADAQAMRTFQDFFSQWCSQFRIYGYVRPVSGLLSSTFQQSIKVFGRAEVDLCAKYPNYRDQLEKFDHVFGASNVSLRRFVRSDLKNGDVVQDIAEQIGLDMTHYSAQAFNESLSLEAVALLFSIRRSEYVQDRVRDNAVAGHLVAPLLSKIKGGKFGLDQRIAARLMEQNAKDIEWVENRIGACVTDMERPVENPIRNNQDLLDIAADAIYLLEALEDDPVFLSAEFTLTDMKRWVQQGLKTGQSI
jgi:hypothetical protein